MPVFKSFKLSTCFVINPIHWPFLMLQNSVSKHSYLLITALAFQSLGTQRTVSPV